MPKFILIIGTELLEYARKFAKEDLTKHLQNLLNN